MFVKTVVSAARVVAKLFCALANCCASNAGGGTAGGGAALASAGGMASVSAISNMTSSSGGLSSNCEPRPGRWFSRREKRRSPMLKTFGAQRKISAKE